MAPLGVILLGPPGAGKGTQADRITREFGLPHISPGDILREQVERDTRLGRQAQEYMEAGELVPDDVIGPVVFERLRQPDCGQGFLLDGFPRGLGQAEALDRELAATGKAISVVLLLEVDGREVVRRLAGRWLCRGCGRPYHEGYGPANVAKRCSECGGELYQRGDDSEETVRRRLEVYSKQTAPLIEHYRALGVLEAIDGNSNPDEVFGRIRQVLSRAAGSQLEPGGA